MTCQQCLRLIQDFLEFPSSTPISFKNLQPLTRTIANEIYRLLMRYNSHHNMYKRVKREYINLVEKKIHTPAKPMNLHLLDVSLNYYNYVLASKEKKRDFEQTILTICMELVQHGIVKYHKSSDPLLTAKLWFLEKYFYCLEHLKDIHDEHSGKVLYSDTVLVPKVTQITEEEVESFNDLYN